MKRILSIGFVLLMCVGLFLAAFGFWCLGTTAGARWLAGAAGKLTGIEITSSKIEGSLLDGLTLTDLGVEWQAGEVLADALTLEVQPASLWNGVLAIEKLNIDRLVLQIVEDESSTSSDEPETKDSGGSLAVAPEWLNVTINHLQITNFSYRSTDNPAAETVIANLIAGQYRLVGNRLTAEDFSYHSPCVELDGAFDWELKRPHLSMTAQVRLPETCVDPAFFNTISVPVSFPGHIEFDGDWNGYSGPVRFGVIDETGDRVWLSAQADGSWRGIRFDGLKGHYLGGDFAGELDLAWIDAYTMHGDLSVQNLDPAAFLKGTTGKASFDVAVELNVPYDDRPLQADIAVRLHDGRFRGHALQGRAAGQWVGNDLVKLNVDLSGDGARLLAKGLPAERVAVDFEVTDLAAFHDELAGRASASGWLRWSEAELAGEIDGYGENLNWQGTKVRRVEFHGHRPAGDESVEIKISGEDWSRGTLHLQRVDADISGTVAAHRLRIATKGSAGHFAATATGSYQADSWAGQLEQLTGQATPWGGWTMPQPTNVAWDNGALTVDALQLQGDRGTTLELDLKDWGSPDRAGLSLAWSGFELDRLQAYVDRTNLSGRSDGEIQYAMSGGEPLAITGQLTAQGHIEDDFFELGYEALELDFAWAEGGLQLNVAARSDTGEAIQARATAPGPLQWRWPVSDLAANLHWQKVDLTRLDRFLDDGHFEGLSDGDFSFSFAEESLAQMVGHLAAQGKIIQGERELGPRSLQAELDWDAVRFRCTAKLIGARDGYASLQLTSAASPALAWPEAGQIDVKLKGLSLSALEPLLPEDVELAGLFDGQARGSWRDQETIDLTGKMQVVESHIDWASEEGLIRLPLREATAEWRWIDDSLTGSFAADLAEQGGLKGTWKLPLPARVPATLRQNDPVQVTLDGRMQAVGILSAIGPWLVQDVRGEMQISLELQGTLENPDLRGEVTFTDGAAYLPIAGVQLEEINLRAELADNRVRIDQLEVHSGPGDMTVQGELVFDHWTLDRYQLDIVGKNLQVVDFPELHILCDPDLTLSGTLDRLSLHGTVLIPVLTIKGSQNAPEILPSKDVVRVKEEDLREELKLATDIQVTVQLGEDVTVKTGGIETQLTGGVIVTLGQTGEVLAKGEVQLVSGRFSAYGTTLQIQQGRLSYGGGPIANPGLRIFAARKVGEVLAGVQVTGSAEAPVVTLYSQPTMPERDILGYMLMGRAVRTDSLDSDMLIIGAGTLLPSYGEGFSELGITEIDIQGLFAGHGGVKLRRQFAEKWELESTLGIESGIDLFYIFEFE